LVEIDSFVEWVVYGSGGTGGAEDCFGGIADGGNAEISCFYCAKHLYFIEYSSPKSEHYPSDNTAIPAKLQSNALNGCKSKGL
jgi:hypothetical protein